MSGVSGRGDRWRMSPLPLQARTGLGRSRTLRGKASTERLTGAGSFRPLAFNLL